MPKKKKKHLRKITLYIFLPQDSINSSVLNIKVKYMLYDLENKSLLLHSMYSMLCDLEN